MRKRYRLDVGCCLETIFVLAIECYYCPTGFVSFSSRWSYWENSTTTGQKIYDFNGMLVIKTIHNSKVQGRDKPRKNKEVQWNKILGAISLRMWELHCRRVHEIESVEVGTKLYWCIYTRNMPINNYKTKNLFFRI